jgi:hypothetical protein
MTAGSLPISSNRAHASRAIPPVALGIELKPLDLATCMAKSILIRLFATKSQLIVPSRAEARRRWCSRTR